MTVAAGAAVAGLLTGWFLGRAGEAGLADTWRQAALDAIDRVTGVADALDEARAEVQDLREQLAAWNDLTRSSDGVYGWHDGHTATWADLGLTGWEDRDDTGDTQGGNG